MEAHKREDKESSGSDGTGLGNGEEKI